jgi:hypothetical protein
MSELVSLIQVIGSTVMLIDSTSELACYGRSVLILMGVQREGVSEVFLSVTLHLPFARVIYAISVIISFIF